MNTLLFNKVLNYNRKKRKDMKRCSWHFNVNTITSWEQYGWLEECRAVIHSRIYRDIIKGFLSAFWRWYTCLDKFISSLLELHITFHYTLLSVIFFQPSLSTPFISPDEGPSQSLWSLAPSFATTPSTLCSSNWYNLQVYPRNWSCTSKTQSEMEG